MKVTYPLIPKSNSSLLSGQFWPIPLGSGAYACGRVLEINPKKRKSFLAGLLDWTGSELPNHDNIAGSKILEQGDALILTITSLGQAILGHRPLELDGIEPELRVDSQSWGHYSYVLKGYETIRKSNPEDHQHLKTQSTWGYNFINLLAENYFKINKTSS